MCGICGCSTGRITTEVVAVEQKILARNDHLAEHNRKWLADNDILAINLMSSPGSGKTTSLERTNQDLDLPVAVIEGARRPQWTLTGSGRRAGRWSRSTPAPAATWTPVWCTPRYRI